MDYVRIRDSDEGGNEAHPPSSPSKSLYVSHFISTWNSRGFEFGAILFLANIYPGTLLPMSIYALFRAVAAITFSPAIGKHIDNGMRLSVIRVSIIGQRSAVALSCVGFWVMLLYGSYVSSLVQHMIFGGLVLLACIEKLSIIANTIAVERDWVVVIAGGNEAILQEMNSQMRRLDLFCKLISPLAIALVDGFSPVLAIVSTLIVNFTSVFAEYFLIASVFRRTPNLAAGLELERQVSQTSAATPIPTQRSCSARFGLRMFKQVKAYAESPAFLPSLALSLLYLTVLSFSGQMVTFLLATTHPSINSFQIGAMRTIATALEISATFIAPLLINKLGAVRAGIWSLSWQFLCLTPGVATLWTNGTNGAASTLTLVVAVILSRIGLWCFDLVAQLQVQNSIDATHRGSFSATESSLQNFFELCAFISTIVWSEPEQFRYPATISLAAIYVAAACYARFVRIERGHLLHMPPCCEALYGNKTARREEEGMEMLARINDT